MGKRITKEELEKFLKKHPDIQSIDMMIPDVNGVLRGKRVTIEGATKLYEDGIRLPRSIYLMDTTGQNCEETTSYGSSDGDPDLPCFGISDTLSIVPWAAEPRAQIMASMYDDNGEAFFGDPRKILQNAIQPFTDMGLKPVVAVELEFYILSNEQDANGRAKLAISNSMKRMQTTTQCYALDELYEYDEFLADIAEACRLQGIPADTAVKEYAAGQYEINLNHCDDPLKAADDAVMLKRIIKNVALKHNYCATFMAKPFEGEAGNGTHIHCSLVDEEGNNYFAGPIDPETNIPMNETLRHAIGGLRDTMPEAMLIFAPNANSYRRLQSGSYAPVNRAWGVDNRTVSLRIPHCDEKSVRVEHRVAGADANPYMVMAAVLAGIHHGLKNKCDPGPIEKGDAYLRGDGKYLPLYWQKAMEVFKAGTILPHYLDEHFHETYEQIRRAECLIFQRVIQPLEYEWYMRSV
ncbi:glutamine synthetase family protein [Curvivirga sp.]|uniref:glutamine synthetase family protein n=1 Tax=Curvivirga sp. TaxID=2856848 RepID=UPI003B593E34